MSATERPWRINPADSREIIADGEPMVICRTPIALYQRQAPDNAALIVKAVNCHDELVEALEACPYPSVSGSPGQYYQRIQEWIRNVQEPALRRARGEQP